MKKKFVSNGEPAKMVKKPTVKIKVVNTEEYEMPVEDFVKGFYVEYGGDGFDQPEDTKAFWSTVDEIAAKCGGGDITRAMYDNEFMFIGGFEDYKTEVWLDVDFNVE